MKILHLIQTSGPGGAEKLLLSLTQNSNDKYTHKVGLLKNGWLCKKLQDRGVAVKIIPSGGSFDIKLIRGLVNLVKKEKIDLIHSHLLDMNFYSCLAAYFAKVPHISTEHGDVHHASKTIDLKTKAKAKAISRFSDRIVFVSEFTKESFRTIATVSDEKAVVIYNGIDPERYEIPVDIRIKKAEIGIKQDEFVIGNVGNLYPVKGQIYLIKAAKIVLKEFPKTKFLIIGRGELENHLKKEANALGIESHIKFLGFREDVKELLKIMDIYVLPSLSEGLPLSLIEAMASKVPVVATGVGGIPEVIGDGINGFLITPADSDALASKIIHLLKDRSFADNFVAQSHKKIQKEFNLHTMLNKYSEIYSHFE